MPLNRWRSILAGWAIGGIALAPDDVRAAGGAHIIDDAAVETPGTCHVESWISAGSRKTGLLNSAPACTRKAWQNLELGGFVAHAWAHGSSASSIGATPKLLLRSEETGVGIGISGSLAYGVDRGRFEAASVIIPMTVPVSDILRLNINAGWQWVRGDSAHAAFAGAQVEIAPVSNLNLMLEGFTRDTGKAGGQLGIRWTTSGGNIDLDLIGGRYIDGIARNTITLGLTIRH